MSYIKVSPTFTALPGFRPVKALTGDLSEAAVIKKADDYRIDRGSIVANERMLFNCLNLDSADNQHVRVANNATLNKSTNDTGLECWVKVEPGEDGGGIIVRYGSSTGEYLAMSSAGLVVYWIGDGTDTYQVTGATDIRDGRWHHVFAYADRDDEAYIYLDGVDDSDSRVGTLADVDSMDNTETLYIGYGAVGYLTGQIDEVRSWVWAGGIPATIATAIAEHYNCPYKLSGLLATGDLKLWLNFDETGGSSFADSSPQSNTGTPYSGGGSTTCATLQENNYLINTLRYEHICAQCGTLAFRLKCFWDADDSTDHVLFYSYSDANNFILLKKDSSNNLVFTIKAGGTEKTATVDVSTAWDTGNWYSVVAVWDTQQKFDGTNYIKLYVDQSTTDANTDVQGYWENIGTAGRLGYDGTYIADAIISIQYDDIPWTGTIANAETANLPQDKSVEYFHNSADFNLPVIDQNTGACLIDELDSNSDLQSGNPVFTVELAEDTETTDSVNHKQAMVTGYAHQFYVGQRLLIGLGIVRSTESSWSDYWETAKIDTGGITDNGDGTITLTFTAALSAGNRAEYTVSNGCIVTNNLCFDGHMDYYGVKAWEVSNAAIHKNRTDRKNGSQSMRVRATAANGYCYTNNITVVAGENYQLSLFRKADADNQCQAIVYDVTNSANILDTGLLTATTWKLLETSFEVPATCVAIEIRLYSDDDTESVNYDDIRLIMNLVDNGGFEGTYSSGVAPGWTKTSSPTVAENASAHSGAKAQGVNGDSSNYLYQDVTVVSGQWYTFSCYIKGTSGKIELSGATTKTFSNDSANYRRWAVTFKAGTTTLTVRIYGDGSEALFDDMVVLPISLTPFSTCIPSAMSNCYETDKWSNSNRAFSLHGGSTIKYSSMGVLNTDKGSIIILFKTPFAYNQFDDRDFYLFEIEDVFKIWYDESEAKFKFQIYDGATWTTAESAAQTFSAGTWLYVICTYDNTSGINIFINTTEGGEVSDIWTAQNLATYIFFWSDKDGGSQPDAVVDYPHGYDEVLTSAQIASIVSGDWGDK